MGSVICVANQKGGVGKTTTCVNLAASLAATQRRVLLIDLDPQANATMGCGIDKNALEYTACDVLLDDIPVADVLQTAPEGGFTVLPSNQELTSAEVELVQRPDREFRLRKALEPVAARFDYILIDCPPALNMLTVNALTAADFVLIPMQCEYFALEGLSALVGTIDRIRATSNPKLTIHGILRTMFDPRNNLANEVSAQLSSHFGERVYNTVIPRNVRLAEAPSFGRPALVHDKYSRGALAYLALAGEVNRRSGNAPPPPPVPPAAPPPAGSS
jgi:chromosome partitioning protein